MKLEDYLDVFNDAPCHDAVVWLETQPDLVTAWQNCERGDWMWWALMYTPGKLPNMIVSMKFAKYCIIDANIQDAYEVYFYSVYSARKAGCDAYSVHNSINDGDAAVATEYRRQAEWIRANVPCPFEDRKA